MSLNGNLTFDTLRMVNTDRCAHSFEHPLDAWSSMEWGCATGGEGGELADAALALIVVAMIGKAQNTTKKLGRIVGGLPGNRSKDSLTTLRQQLAAEMADAIIYMDLWAAREGIDLGVAIIETFNAVSERIGAGQRL